MPEQDPNPPGDRTPRGPETTAPVSSTLPGDQSPDWQRLSPLSVIDFFITLLRQGVTQYIPALAVLIASAASSENLDLAFVFLGVAVLLLLLMVYGVLAYLRFGFQLSSRRISVRKGVLHRELLNIDQDRIQNITIHEPFYFRPFGLAALGIDTAGSSGKEVRLSGIPLASARALRDQLVDEAQLPAQTGSEAEGETAHDGVAAQPEAPTLLLRLSRRDVFIAGLTANFMLWAAVAIGAIFGAGETSEQLIDWLVRETQIKQTVEAVRAEGGDLMAGLLALGVISLAFLLLPVISMIGALFRYDGYELTVNGDRFRRTSGLIGRHDESVRQHKIQAVTWKQNAIARLFGRINLQLRQATASQGVESGNISAGSMLKQTFPVPSLHPEQAESLSKLFLPGYEPGSGDFSRVDLRRYMTIGPALMLTPLAIGLGAMGAFIDWRFALAWVPVAIAVLLIHYMLWRRTGWAVSGDHGMLRTGFIGATTNIFPLFKVQRVDVTQTRGMRKRDLAHLTIHLASHSTTLPWMDAEDAFHFRDLAIYEAERRGDAWF